MKTSIIKQEILLMITPFSQKELCKNKTPKSSRHQSHAEQLEEACWDGLLDELLDSIIEKTVSGKRLCLWHTQQRASFLEIELCNDPQFTERHLSIELYSFLPIVSQN
jgi:hypothetical protein